MNKDSNLTRRGIRLPKQIIQMLQDLRDSYITPRPIPKLVTVCLKVTRGVDVLNLAPTTRAGSEKIDVWLDDEFAALDHSEITARIAHALIGIPAKFIQMNIEMNRNVTNEPKTTEVENGR